MRPSYRCKRSQTRAHTHSYERTHTHPTSMSISEEPSQTDKSQDSTIGLKQYSHQHRAVCRVMHAHHRHQRVNLLPLSPAPGDTLLLPLWYIYRGYKGEGVYLLSRNFHILLLQLSLNKHSGEMMSARVRVSCE
jgi:hypothetical protein